MADSKKNAVLLLAHGSPDLVEQVPDFLLRVTGGRPLPQPVVKEVKHRYGLIGRSPLTELTLKQAELLAGELCMPVYVGMRNWKPFIADAVRAMVFDGIERAVAICLAPQNSRTSVGLYRSDLASNQGTAFAVDFVESWHDHPLLIRAFADKLRAGLDRARREARTQEIPIIFTAHSVPERTIADGDPYESQTKETASLVAREAALASEDWTFAFQSQGMSGGAWLGPRVEDTILILNEKGHRHVFIQPIGFLCDHVEVLYDIDIGFKQFAAAQGMRLWRAESLNDSSLLVAALADVARTRFSQSLRASK
ncbi:MAG TPA: ferrochelatase [Terriglobales bacterium]|nr:ferrochelatase [Terriglobales bacterium]